MPDVPSRCVVWEKKITRCLALSRQAWRVGVRTQCCGFRGDTYRSRFQECGNRRSCRALHALVVRRTCVQDAAMLLALLSCVLLVSAPAAQADSRGFLTRWLEHRQGRGGSGPSTPPGAPAAYSQAPVQCGHEHPRAYLNICAAEEAACGGLDQNCCPPEDPDAPPTGAGPEYTCNDPELFCRSRQIGQTSAIPPSILWERLCLVGLLLCCMVHDACRACGLCHCAQLFPDSQALCV